MNGTKKSQALIEAESKIVDVVYSHIDRFNDPCEEDDLDNIARDFLYAVNPEIKNHLKIVRKEMKEKSVRREKPLIKWVWIMQVCDYESCWPMQLFDSESKARQYCDRYKLSGDEQSKCIYKKRIF